MGLEIWWEQRGFEKGFGYNGKETMEELLGHTEELVFELGDLPPQLSTYPLYKTKDWLKIKKRPGLSSRRKSYLGVD